MLEKTFRFIGDLADDWEDGEETSFPFEDEHGIVCGNEFVRDEDGTWWEQIDEEFIDNVYTAVYRKISRKTFKLFGEPYGTSDGFPYEKDGKIFLGSPVVKTDSGVWALEKKRLFPGFYEAQYVAVTGDLAETVFVERDGIWWDLDMKERKVFEMFGTIYGGSEYKFPRQTEDGITIGAPKVRENGKIWIRVAHEVKNGRYYAEYEVQPCGN